MVNVEIPIPGLSTGVPSVHITSTMRAQRVDRSLSGKREKGFSIAGNSFVSHRLRERYHSPGSSAIPKCPRRNELKVG